ncbi:AmmeMemoRadiSam system protein B [Marispirochaeta sp.]|uniref:AmmeMemoRadiSam system protein B n=1 Tax=Marispirochaeta sp. TaxID=2038653 RepID=UPI0029C7BAF6|nr:AmmeMemoRadiSam system protein B [Marispirochaeta sp.]
MHRYPLSCATDDLRPLLAAGHFFSGDNEKLGSQFDKLFSSQKRPSKKQARAAIVPHGAVTYAGPGLTWALQRLSLESADAVILLAQVHRETEDTIWLPDYSGFMTPFGTLTVPSRKTLEEISGFADLFRTGRIPFEEEPCFDMILSALSYLGFSGQILPILFGSDRDSLKKAGLDLLDYLDPAYLPVIISNHIKDPHSGIIEAQDGKNLVKLLETHLSAPPARWYHGENPQYCAALWTRSDVEDAEKVRGKE